MFATGSFTNSANASPEEIARKRAMIAALMPKFGSARYVGEGIGQLATGIAMGRQNKKLDAAEATGRQGAQDRFSALFGGMRGTAQPGGFSVLGSMPVEPTPAQGVANDAMTALGKTPMQPYRDAIASIESDGSGGYAAIGPTNPTLGRAMGRYQIMEANIAPWSKEVLGREVTPDEFIQNPQLQDAIFDGKFGGYVDQYGPEGAAQAWFAGPGGVGKTDRQDVLGTSVGDYTQKFSNALGGAPMAGPQGAAAAVPIEALYTAMSDPWTSPEQKAVIGQMIEQQQQMMDPSYQMGIEADRLGIEKSRLELDALQNPAPEPGYTTMTPEQAAQIGLPEGGVYQMGPNGEIKIVQAAQGAAGTNEYGLQPVYGTDAEGNTVVMQLGKNGQAVATQLPEGVKPDLSVKGYEQAYGTGRGKIDAEGDASAPADLQAAENALSMIRDVRDDPNRGRGTGKSSWFNWIPGTAGYDFENKVGQVKSGAFLTAIQALRGLGALSNTEGTAATAAITRLDTATSEEAFLSALADYEKIVQQGYDKAAQRLGGRAAPAVTSASDDDLLKMYGGGN